MPPQRHAWALIIMIKHLPIFQLTQHRDLNEQIWEFLFAVLWKQTPLGAGVSLPTFDYDFNVKSNNEHLISIIKMRYNGMNNWLKSWKTTNSYSAQRLFSSSLSLDPMHKVSLPRGFQTKNDFFAVLCMFRFVNFFWCIIPSTLSRRFLYGINWIVFPV